MTSSANSTRRFYEYHPDVNRFAAVEFVSGPVYGTGDSSTVTDLHWRDEPVRDTWIPLKCDGFDGDPPKVGDFPSVNDYSKIPMMSERAWSVLEPIIGDACEALPLMHPFPGTYYLIHVMQTIDALDITASDVEFLHDEDDDAYVADKRIWRIDRYAFKYDLIEGQHIFKLPLMSGSGLIVDDVFRKTVEDRGLRGLRFKELPLAEDR